MRSRRSHLVLAVAGLIVAATLWYLLRQTPLVADQVARAFTANLLQERGYRLEIRRLRGNPLGELTIEGVSVLEAGPGGKTVAAIERVELRLDARRLLRGRVNVHRLRLVEPQIHLGPNELALSGSPRSGSQPPPPPLQLSGLEIEGGNLVAQLDSVRTLNVDSLAAQLELELSGGEVHLRLGALAARIPSHGVELRHATGWLHVTPAGIRLEDIRLETGRSQVTLTGERASQQGAWRLAGQAAPLALEDLNAVVLLPVQGVLTGPFELGWKGGVLDFEGIWSGTYLERRFESVQVDLTWSPEKLELHQARGRLQDGAFALTLEAREPAIQGRVQIENFDLRAWRADLPESRVTGRVDFSRPAPEDTLDLQVVLRDSRLAGCALTRAQAHASLLGSEARFHEIYLQTATGSALASGTLHEARLDLGWELDASDVAAFLAPLELGDLHGAAQLQGRFEGRLDSLSATAAGDFGALRYGSLAAGSGAIELRAARLSPVPEVALEVRGEGLAYGTRPLGRFTGSMGYDGADLELRRVEVVADDTLLAFAAVIGARDEDWNGERHSTTQMQLQTALLQIGGQEFRVEEPATLWWRQGAVQVDSLRLVARGSRARLDGGFDLETARIDARTEIDAFDLGFLARLAQARVNVAGIGTGWIELHGRLDATQIDSRLVVQAGEYNDLALDSLRVDLQSEAFGTAVRAASLHTRFGSIRAHGRLAYLPSLQRWLQGASGSRAPEELARAPLEGRVELDNLALEPFWRALRGIQAPSAWGARLTAACDLAGSIEAPQVAIRGAARGAHMGASIDADSLHFACRYADGTLHLPELRLDAAGARLLVEGRLPVRWSLTGPPQLQRGEAMEMNLTLERSSFAVVPRFISLFEPAPQGVPAGAVEGSLHVEGTPNAPKLHGELLVQGAGFTLANMEEVFRDVHARGTFREDTLELTEIRGRSGKEGWVAGKGWVRFARLQVLDYALAFDADQIPVYSVPDIEALMGGHIEVTAVRLAEVANPVPNFVGALKIHQAEITREFTTRAEESGGLLESTDRPEWLAEVAIEAPARVWVRNANADAELSGSVQIIRNTAGLDVQGRATARRGHYSAYLEKFEITRGELDFSRHQGWEPEMDIEARRGRVNERIYVHLSGRPSEPRLVFTSDGRGSSEELQHILMADVRNDPANVATTVVENVFDDVGYLDSITIDPATSRGEPVAAGQQAPLISAYNVSAGWAVSDRVFVTYTRGLNQSDLNQRVAIELDVLRGLLLASSWEIRYIPSPEFLSDAAQNAFNVDVKFRHEY